MSIEVEVLVLILLVNEPLQLLIHLAYQLLDEFSELVFRFLELLSLLSVVDNHLEKLLLCITQLHPLILLPAYNDVAKLNDYFLEMQELLFLAHDLHHFLVYLVQNLYPLLQPVLLQQQFPVLVRINVMRLSKLHFGFVLFFLGCFELRCKVLDKCLHLVLLLAELLLQLEQFNVLLLYLCIQLLNILRPLI